MAEGAGDEKHKIGVIKKKKVNFNLLHIPEWFIFSPLLTFAIKPHVVNISERFESEFLELFDPQQHYFYASLLLTSYG